MISLAPVSHYRGNNDNFPKFIFFSLIIHLIVVTVILVSIPTTSRHLTFGTAYSVRLVGSEAVMRSGNSSSLNGILESKKSFDSIIIKKKINSIYSTPMKTQKTAKLNIEKAVSAIRQKENAGSQINNTASVSSISSMSDADVNVQTNEYIGAVWSRVKQNWTIPQSLLPEKNITTIVEVKIARSGALQYANFEQRSGNRYFDDSALRAVKKSSPFPPLPYWVRDNSIEIGIRFHSSELR
ncbi:MAG: TonB C-terminal domain-containing protein [Syntrophaceae bacterium]|nr:TonB C-terminal domain-containing protein [Syntrophaceae bacterium]